MEMENCGDVSPVLRPLSGWKIGGVEVRSDLSLEHEELVFGFLAEHAKEQRPERSEDEGGGASAAHAETTRPALGVNGGLSYQLDRAISPHFVACR